MKKILFSILTLGITLGYAQNDSELIKNATKIKVISSEDTLEGWKKGGVFTLNFSNVGLQNWAAGGSNSYAFNSMVGLFADYKKNNVSWDNNLDLGFGMIQQFTPFTKAEDRRWVKSDDKIDLTSKYGQRASDKWNYSGLLNFKSQFMDGYADPYADKDSLVRISKLFAPAYAIAAIGMDFKPNSEVTLFLAPVTAKITIVADDELNARGAFGVDSNKVIRAEAGFYLRMSYKKDVVENVTFSSKLELFQNYERLGHIDVNWETLTSMKVNKYISATFSTQLIYDDDIDIAQGRDDVTGLPLKVGPAVQFKHVLGVGLTYKF